MPEPSAMMYIVSSTVYSLVDETMMIYKRLQSMDVGPPEQSCISGYIRAWHLGFPSCDLCRVHMRLHDYTFTVVVPSHFLFSFLF